MYDYTGHARVNKFEAQGDTWSDDMFSRCYQYQKLALLLYQFIATREEVFVFSRLIALPGGYVPRRSRLNTTLRSAELPMFSFIRFIFPLA